MDHATAAKPQASTQGTPDDHSAAFGKKWHLGGLDLRLRRTAPYGIVPDCPQTRRSTGGPHRRLEVELTCQVAPKVNIVFRFWCTATPVESLALLVQYDGIVTDAASRHVIIWEGTSKTAMSHGTKQLIALVTFLLLSVVVRGAIYYQRALGGAEYVKVALVVLWVLGLCVGVYWYVLDLQKQREERNRRK